MSELYLRQRQVIVTAPTDRPVCPMCGEPGIHSSAQACIDTLRATIDQLTTQKASRPIDPAITHEEET